jgi:PAS domain S-box-containing protein
MSIAIDGFGHPQSLFLIIKLNLYYKCKCELSIRRTALSEFNLSIRRCMPLIKKLFWILSVLLLFNPALLAQQEAKPKNVLVLATYSPTAPVGHLWNRGIQSVFNGGAADEIKIHIEHLDLIRLQDDRYVQLLLDIYRYKYSNVKPDLIIPIYNGALDFMLRYGPELFPNIPIVFGGVEKRFVESRNLGPHISGVFNVNSYRETLDLALGLHPGTRHVAMVAGAGIIGSAWGPEARKSYRSYTDRLDFIDLMGLPMPEILKKVANLPPQSVVIYITLLEDGAGNKFTAPESVSQISRTANAPTYSFWDLVLGQGIVGGFLSNAEKKGEAVAELGLRILNGVKPTDLPIMLENNLQYKFDWRQLKRWSIPEAALPPGSVVRSKEYSAWDRYKGRLIAASALLILQFLLIASLWHSLRKRRRLERSRDELLKFERLIARLSSDLINIAAEKVDARIIEVLRQIGIFLNVDRSFLFRFNWDKTEFRISHLWEADDIQKDKVVPGVIVKKLFPWLAGNLLNGKDILIPDVKALSTDTETQNEYEYCKQLGIQSFLVLPIQVEASPLCAIGLDSFQIQRKWPAEVQDRLRLLGEILANTLARSHAEERITATEFKYRTVADFTYDWEYWANFDGTLQYVSPSCERISGYTPQEFEDNPGLFREIIVAEDRKIWDEHYQESRQEFKPHEIQFRIQRKDGQIRWIEHACQPIPDTRGGFSGFRASNRDITERKEAGLALVAAYDEIKALKDQLESESTYLQEEIKLEHNFENIIGRSEELKYVLY